MILSTKYVMYEKLVDKVIPDNAVNIEVRRNVNVKGLKDFWLAF